MHISLFDFELPEELIAQSPVGKRDESRLLVLNKVEKTIEHKHFFDIVDYLRKGDVLVRNNTRVIPARLFGIKEITNAKVEVLLLKQIKPDIWECLVGNAKTVKVGVVINFGNGKLKGECLEVKDEGIRIFKMIYQGIFLEVLESLGKMPLPPYIKTQTCENSRYQTTYAKIQGSSAAPTAGFHFTEEIFQKLKDKGVEVVDVTLHIGLGTFRPVKVDDVLAHEMHHEYYEMNEEVATLLNQAKKEHRRIIAIGTTSTRVLESVVKEHGEFKASKGDTNIFIYPPYQFKAIDGLITNFHLPKSTLIMLVSALAGRDFVLEAYKTAVKERYRFFSFGDAMFIYE